MGSSLLSPEKDPIVEPLIRAPEYEAVDAIRGYVFQFLVVIETVLQGGDDATVFVEAFEDVCNVLGDVLKLKQIKDRAGTFSVTQVTSLEMLERWAAAHRSMPRAMFAFVSRQSAGGMHDRNDAFKRWAAGPRDDPTALSIAASIRTFLRGQERGMFPGLRELLADDGRFLPLWQQITWRLNEPPLTSRYEQLITGVAASESCDPAEAREVLLGWLGAVALSAGDARVEERRWTLARLRGTRSNRDRRLLALSAALRIIDAFESNQTFELLLQVFAELNALHSTLGIKLDTIVESQHRIERGQAEMARAVAGLRADWDAAAAIVWPGEPTESHARRSFLAERAASLEAELRSAMDEEGRRLVDRLHEECAALNLRTAVAAARELESWLDGKGVRASSDVRAQVCTLLADLFVIEQYAASGADRIDTARPWQLYRRACELAGAH